MTEATGQTAFTTFWLYQRRDTWHESGIGGASEAEAQFASVLNKPGEGVEVRGVYSSLGLSAGADLIIWAVSSKLDRLQQLAVAVDKSAIGRQLRMRFNYAGMAGTSQYDKEHGPAFLRGTPPKRYLSVYPFTKTPDWYLVPFEERRRLMIEHGQMGREFPTILTNTVNSFGIQDQEFIVALEDDDPGELIKMVQRLRAAEVRKYTAADTPIFLGDRKPVKDVLADLRGR